MTPNATSAGRLEHLDGLRGLAASIVVLCHFVWALFPFGTMGGASPLHGGWECVLLYPPLGLLVAGHFAVCLFFLLSGYVLALPFLLKGTHWKDLVVAAVKRPFRLMGIVLATTLLSWLLWRLGLYHNHEVARLSGSAWFDFFWSSESPENGVFASQFISSTFDLATACNPPLWTIKRELLGSFIVYGILLVGRTWLLRWGILIVSAWWFSGNFFQCFIIGVMIADFHCWWGRTLPVARFPLWLSVALIIITVICGSYPKYAMTYSADAASSYWFLSPRLPWLGGGWSMVGAIALFILVLHSPIAQRLLTRRPVLFLGKVSYSLYGVHFLILGSLSSWMFLAALPVAGYLGAASLALVSLVLCTLVFAKVLHETVDTFSIWGARVVGTQVRRLLNWRAVPAVEAGPVVERQFQPNDF
jgi:peptidoglycan/LPS O-acetylase OafA/YrhL